MVPRHLKWVEPEQDIRRIIYCTKTVISQLRVHFFKKIQDQILKSERIRKRILRFFSKQIYPRSHRSWYVKEFTTTEDSAVPLTHYGPRHLGLICLVKKPKIHFPILSDLRI